MGAIRTVTAEDEGLAAAIAETEQEIFTEANGDEQPENTGDKSLEEMGDDLEGRTNEEVEEPEEEENPELEAGDEEPTEEAEEAPQRATDGALVPSGRLRETTARARAAEAEAATLREQMAELRGRMDQFTRQQPQTQQDKPTVPDMFADPEGWQNHIKAQLAADFEQKRVDASLSEAAEAHGAKFTEAYQNLRAFGQSEMQQNGGKSPTVARIWNSPNPGKALLSWHQQQTALKEIGGDLNGYKDKLKDELLNDPDFVASVIQRARGEATNGRRANRTLPSLNGASGRRHTDMDPDLHDNSESSVFGYAIRP